jgi:hypothetical protein
MASAFAVVAGKNAMLDALTADRVQLHSGDPGSSGTSNQLGTKVAATFSAASSGSRALASQVDFTGLTALQSVTWYSVWDNNGGSPVFLGRGEITAGDVAANAAGEYSLTTSCALTLSDPA